MSAREMAHWSPSTSPPSISPRTSLVAKSSTRRLSDGPSRSEFADIPRRGSLYHLLELPLQGEGLRIRGGSHGSREGRFVSRIHTLGLLPVTHFRREVPGTGTGLTLRPYTPLGLPFPIARY